jgi:hypothetical protein
MDTSDVDRILKGLVPAGSPTWADLERMTPEERAAFAHVLADQNTRRNIEIMDRDAP